VIHTHRAFALSLPQGARRATDRARRGATIVEVLIAVAVLVIGVLAYSRALIQSADIEASNNETALATAGVQRVAELVNGTTFEQIFAAFDDTDADDALVTAPNGQVWGSGFRVDGLAVRGGDPDGLPGEVVFPTVDNGGTLELREDVVDDELGMPRDLNLDGVIDSADHSADYKILPVTIRVEWESGERDRELEIHTILGAR